MKNAIQKIYEITEKRLAGHWEDSPKWEWIPHEKQPLTLLSAIKENRDLFQDLNDEFWLDHVNPFFITNDKKKLRIERGRSDDTVQWSHDYKSGYWDGAKKDEPIYNKFNNLIIKHVDVDEAIDYQDEIYNRAEKALSAGKITGGFALDTVKNALLMFVSSDVKNCIKYFKVLDLRSKIFTLPISGIETLKEGERYGGYWSDYVVNIADEICEIPKDYNRFDLSYGSDASYTWGGNEYLFYSMANGLSSGRETVSKTILELINKEFKFKDFYKEFFPVGFMEYVNKEKSKNTKLKLPKKLNNKMDFSIWKNIASKSKMSNKTFDQLISVFGYSKLSHPYFFEGLNHLLNQDAKLHTRQYFLNFLSGYREISLISETNDNIHPFWFREFFNTTSTSLADFVIGSRAEDDINAKFGENYLPQKLIINFNLTYSLYLINKSAINEVDRVRFEEIVALIKKWALSMQTFQNKWVSQNKILCKFDPDFVETILSQNENLKSS
jgi:hypothetical protein